MRASLRDEILVVMRYESKKMPSGLALMQKIEMFRDKTGVNRKVSLRDMTAELRTLVIGGFLNPWLWTGKNVKKIEDIGRFHLINEVYYSLTYAGHYEHLRAIEHFVHNDIDFRLYLRSKPGQS